MSVRVLVSVCACMCVRIPALPLLPSLLSIGHSPLEGQLVQLLLPPTSRLISAAAAAPH